MTMDIVKVLGGFALLMFMIVFGAIMNGYVVSVLWGWFIVPTFDAPTLNIPSAIGIALVVRVLTHQQQAQKEVDEDKSFAHLLIMAFLLILIQALLTLLAGYIIHLYM